MKQASKTCVGAEVPGRDWLMNYNHSDRPGPHGPANCMAESPQAWRCQNPAIIAENSPAYGFFSEKARIMSSTLQQALVRAGAVLAPLALAACSSLTDVPPGTSLAQVQAQYGAPSYSCTGRDGQQRVIWTTQPMGQYAWGANVDSAGNIDQIEPVLTNSSFRKLGEGSWNQEQVYCEFGPPAEIGPVGMPSVRQEVWSYRYKESGAWNSLMHIYFDPYTGKVTRFHSGPDPMFDPREFWLF